MSEFISALNNDTISMSTYLKYGDVNAVDEKGLSLLHYAARGNSMEVANLLLSNNIDVNIKDNLGETPIFTSVRMGSIGFTKLLIRKGANLRVENLKGESLYMLACQKGLDDMMDLLNDHGGRNIDSVNVNGENILFYLLKGRKVGLFLEIANKFPKLITKSDFRNVNLLMLAIKYDFINVAQFLINHGISLYSYDKNGNNSLFWASRLASYEMVEYLLTLHPIIEGKNNDGETIFEFGKDNTSIINRLDLYNNSIAYITYKKTYPEFIAVINKDYDYLMSHNIDKNKRDVFNTSLALIVNGVNDSNIKKILQ